MLQPDFKHLLRTANQTSTAGLRVLRHMHHRLTFRRHIVIDLGFAIEACETDTLPECVLGSVRLSRIDVNKPPMVEALPNDWILGSHGDQHGGGSASAGGEDSTADSK